MANEPEAGGSVDPNEIADFLMRFENEKARSGDRSVLILDDEPTVRRMVNRSLTTLDPSLKVVEAENGVEGLAKFDEIRKNDGHDPVLIVTDLQMPVMDGWEFIDALWKKFQAEGRDNGVPLIVLSASTGTKGLIFGKSVHGDKCPYKPFVTVAKADCVKPMKYDSKGEQGLKAWLKYFLRQF